MVDPAEFYDALAEQYDVLFGDWWDAASWHGAAVQRLLESYGVRPPARVLDCTCGIGTQALPLARSGYLVTGTDISSEAVARARREAVARDIEVMLQVVDVRRVREQVDGLFDAVISCDNALPHLLDDHDLAAALGNLRACLAEGGLLVASIRDYDDLAARRPHGVPITLHGPGGARHGAGQAWAWTDDGEFVDITLFTLSETADGWRSEAHETRYRALRREVLTTSLQRQGFSSVRWLMPSESGYFQPVVVARAAPEA